MHMRPDEKPSFAGESFFLSRLSLQPNLNLSTFHLRNEHFQIGAEFTAFEIICHILLKDDELEALMKTSCFRIRNELQPYLFEEEELQSPEKALVAVVGK